MSSKSVKKIELKRRQPRSKKVVKINKKPEFKVKKKITKVSYADVCAVPALKRDIAGTVNVGAFNYLADHCTSKINETTGRIPKTGESFSFGRLVHYFYRCHAAYQLRAGVFVGDVANHQEFLNFAVPGYVATLFENSCVFRDERIGAILRLQDNNYDTAMHALIVNEGSTRCQVWDTNAALNEPIFSNGVAIGYSDLTLANARELSDLITKAFKHVTFVKDIKKKAVRLNDLLGQSNTSFKPQSPFQLRLSLASYFATIYPATNNASTPMNWVGNTEVKGMQYFLEDYQYVKGRTINKMASSFGVNPYRFGVTLVEVSAVNFSALVATVIKETGTIAPNTNGLAAWRFYVNNYIYMFCSYFARCSWISRTAFSGASPPTYINEPMKSMFLPPLFAMLGTKPICHGDSLVVPTFVYNLSTSALLSQWQSSSTVTASTSAAFGLGTAVFGAIASQLTLFNSLSPYPAGIKYNFVPLNVLDYVTSYASTNAFNSVEVAYSRVDVGSSFCDCLTNSTFSTDTFQADQGVGDNFTINWMEVRALVSDCFVDDMACACSKGASLFLASNVNTLAMHAELVYTNTGETTSLVIQSGIRDSNFDNMFAAMQNKDIGKAALGYFKSKLSQSFHQESILVASDNFADMVRRVATQDLALPPAPPDWMSRLAGTNIAHAVLASAGAVATYGPKVYQALRQLTDISVKAMA